MSGCITKTLAYNNRVRILFSENTDIAKKLCADTSNPLLKTVLAKSITITSLLSGLLKDRQRISMRMEFTNLEYKIATDADCFGNIRGYLSDKLKSSTDSVNEHTSIKTLIGNKGVIRVMKDIGLNSIVTGITDMPFSTIDDNFSYFFKQSEQTLSYFWTFCDFDENGDVRSSIGVLIQLLPGAHKNLLNRSKKIIAENKNTLCTTQNGCFPSHAVTCLFDELHIIENMPVQFFCGCSKEMMLSMLLSLTREELVQAYENNTPLELCCNICGELYNYEQNDILRLLEI